MELGRMLEEAGIRRNTCFVTSAFRERPKDGEVSVYLPQKRKDITPEHVQTEHGACLPVVLQWRATLEQEIALVQPNVIIALGDAAMWMLTGRYGVFKWRASHLTTALPGLATPIKVIPTLPPGLVLRMWSWRQIVVQDLRRAARESAYPEVRKPDWGFTIAPDFGQVIGVLDQLIANVMQAPLKIAVDIETRCGYISDIGIAWSPTDAMCIPFMTVQRPEGYWTAAEEADIVYRLYTLFTHPNLRRENGGKLVGQNFSYDAQFIHRGYLFSIDSPVDTMLLQHSLFSTMKKSLDFLASMYCEYYSYWKDEGREWDDSMPEEQHWTYNCQDLVYTYEVESALSAATAATGLREVSDFQQSLFGPVFRTMQRGLRVDKRRKSEFAATLLDEIAVRQQWLNDAIGFELNISSPKQMSTFFYELLRQKPNYNRKSGGITCDDEALRTIATREPLLRPMVNKIMELRSLGVFLNTFVLAGEDYDGRMRCSFNIAGTETYRFASSKNAFGSGLNMQNIPKGGDNDELDLSLPNVRSLFIPDPGKTFFDIDLDSADLRIVCWESDCAEMMRMLAEGAKVYVEVMKEYYRDPTLTKHSSKYTIFKSLCHGTNYLGSAKGLAERLGLGVQEVDVIQKWYFGKFPEILRWHDELKDQVVKRRYVQNVFGYRNYFFDRIEGTIFNQAVAWIPQSTVACLINRAYVAIDRELKDVEILLQVHDSLAGQFPTADADRHLADILRLAHIDLPYEKPLVIPVGVKTSTASWGDCD